MRRFLLLTAALSALLPGLRGSARAGQTNEEQCLIAVLQLGASPAEKDAACARLKLVGTDRSVPALAELLTDEQLSHSARYALECLPSAKAGRALTAALAKTSGLTRAGIISSLGCRGEARAVSALVRLLREPDAGEAAALALGQIGGAKALKALRSATARTTGPAHRAAVDGCLRCANRLLAAGKQSKARAVFEQLYASEKEDAVRVAACRGMIQASGKGALPLMSAAITGEEGASQIAALQLVREVAAPGATKTFGTLLPAVAPPVQVALIEGLSQRGDASAAGDIVVMVSSASPEVRVAALNALGILGDATAVPLLAVTAASAAGAEQKAARLALIQLRRGKVTETLLRLLPEAKPEVQAEVARALGERGDTTAVPTLVALAGQGSEAAARVAWQALALLVDDSQLGIMVQFVVEAKSEAARADAAEALNSACRQIQIRRGRINLEPLLQALGSGTTETRIALLSVCSGLADPGVRAVLRSAVASAEPSIRGAAIRALCDTGDAELLPDVLKVACAAPEANFRTLGIRACVRLTTQEDAIKLPVKEQIEPLQTILATTLSPEQRRLVLAGLAEIPDLQALRLAEPMLDEAAIQLEAAQAITRIAAALPYAQASEATRALTRVVAATTDADTRKAAETALNDIQAGADYITSWMVSGPYLQEGKDYKQLFDMAFPPEIAGARSVKWKKLPPGAEAKRPWVMDLLKACGGEQRVAYARTWVYSGEPQPARLELGTDDGVKVWLNQRVVHTNNILRGLTPGEDKLKVSLNQGWNALLLKVTQLNAGWGFCARFRKPDGSHLDGLQFATQRPARANRAQ